MGNSSSQISEREENKDDIKETAAKAAGVAASVALAAWGISKLVGNSSESTSSEKRPMQEVGFSPQVYSAPAHYPSNFPDPVMRQLGPTRYTLNCDGSVVRKPGEEIKAAAGGLIRDDKGEWVLGFSWKLRSCEITCAELFALRKGLILAQEKRLTNLVIYVDSEEVVNLIRKPDVKNHRLGLIIQECKNLVEKHDWVIEQTSRMENSCADFLARKLGHELPDYECRIFEKPPLGMENLLLKDMNGSRLLKYSYGF